MKRKGIGFSLAFIILMAFMSDCDRKNPPVEMNNAAEQVETPTVPEEKPSDAAEIKQDFCPRNRSIPILYCDGKTRSEESADVQETGCPQIKLDRDKIKAMLEELMAEEEVAGRLSGADTAKFTTNLDLKYEKYKGRCYLTMGPWSISEGWGWLSFAEEFEDMDPSATDAPENVYNMTTCVWSFAHSSWNLHVTFQACDHYFILGHSLVHTDFD